MRQAGALFSPHKSSKLLYAYTSCQIKTSIYLIDHQVSLVNCSTGWNLRPWCCSYIKLSSFYYFFIYQFSPSMYNIHLFFLSTKNGRHLYFHASVTYFILDSWQTSEIRSTWICLSAFACATLIRFTNN